MDRNSSKLTVCSVWNSRIENLAVIILKIFLTWQRRLLLLFTLISPITTTFALIFPICISSLVLITSTTLFRLLLLVKVGFFNDVFAGTRPCIGSNSWTDFFGRDRLSRIVICSVARYQFVLWYIMSLIWLFSMMISAILAISASGISSSCCFVSIVIFGSRIDSRIRSRFNRNATNFVRYLFQWDFVIWRLLLLLMVPTPFWTISTTL